MDYITKLKFDTNNADDIIYKEITINKEKVNLIYSEVLTSSQSVNDFILKNLSHVIDHNITFNNIYDFLINSIPAHNIKEIKNY